MKKLKTNIYAYVKEYKDQGGSYSDLAKTIGVTRQTISLIALRRCEPSLPVAIHLANLLGFSLNDLKVLKFKDQP